MLPSARHMLGARNISTKILPTTGPAPGPGAGWFWGVGTPSRYVLLRTIAPDNTYTGTWSDDGFTWNQVNLPVVPNLIWQHIMYGNGLFVIAGDNVSASVAFDEYMTSPDGINWTVRNFPLEIIGAQPAFNGSVFVIGHNAGWLYSTDGTNWTNFTTHKFPSNIYTNGISFTMPGPSSPTPPHDADAVWSIDGLNWQPIIGFPFATVSGADGATSNSEVYLALTASGAPVGQVWSSSTGETWTHISTVPGAVSIITDGTVFVTSSNLTPGVLYISYDNGFSWHTHPSNIDMHGKHFITRGPQYTNTANPILVTTTQSDQPIGMLIL